VVGVADKDRKFYPLGIAVTTTEWEEAFAFTFKVLKENCSELKPEDWKQSTCICHDFLKKYMCKHVVGLAITNTAIIVPDIAKTDLLGSKPRDGRPKKVKGALLVD